MCPIVSDRNPLENEIQISKFEEKTKNKIHWNPNDSTDANFFEKIGQQQKISKKKKRQIKFIIDSTNFGNSFLSNVERLFSPLDSLM